MAVPAPAPAPPAGIRVVLPRKAAYNYHFPGGEFNMDDIEINPAELFPNQHFTLVGVPYLMPMPPFGMMVQDGRLHTEVRIRFPDGNDLVFPVDSKIIKKPILHFEGFYIELQSDDQGQPIQFPPPPVQPQNGGRRRRTMRSRRRRAMRSRRRRTMRSRRAMRRH